MLDVSVTRDSLPEGEHMSEHEKKAPPQGEQAAKPEEEHGEELSEQALDGVAGGVRPLYSSDPQEGGEFS
jgi:hypothetical protein